MLDGVMLAMGPGGTRRRVALRDLQSREPLALDLARVHIQRGAGLATGAAAGRALAENAAAAAGSRPRRRSNICRARSQCGRTGLC